MTESSSDGDRPETQDEGMKTPGGGTRIVMLLFGVVVLMTIVMMILSFPAGLYTVFGTNLSGNYSASTPVYSLNYDLVFFSVTIPVVTNLGTLFATFLGIYLVFFVIAAKQGPGFIGALRASATDGFAALMRNPLVGLTVLLGALTLATEIIESLQSSAGIQTGGLGGDPFSLFVQLTVAPLLEETAYRFIMIGVPVSLLVLFAARSPSKALRALWRPSVAWDGELPGTSAIKAYTYVLVLISSLLFGYAHYASGIGWGVGKVSTAALAGVVLGYLYVRYGFHSNVLLHWGVNYVGTVYSFLAQGLYGIPWTSDNGSIFDSLPGYLIIFILGVPGLLLVVNQMARSVISRVSSTPGDGSSR